MMTQRSHGLSKHSHKEVSPQVAKALTLPVMFRIKITAYERVLRVGRWFVALDAKDEPSNTMQIESQGRWLESCFEMQRDRNSSTALEFLLKYGNFRPSPPALTSGRVPWQLIQARSKHLFEAQEWRQLNSAGFSDMSTITIIRVVDFWQEWKLLELIAEIAGNLTRRTSPILFKTKVDEALKVLEELRLSGIGSSMFDAYNNTQASVSADSPKTKDRLSSQIRSDVRTLLWRAVNRALGPLKTVKFLTSPDGKPNFQLHVDSVLGYSYFCLLANFAENWKRCSRADCHNVFLSSGRKKKYCTWYCGHIESVRRGRRPKSRH
jgi:hypothetical protein